MRLRPASRLARRAAGRSRAAGRRRRASRTARRRALRRSSRAAPGPRPRRRTARGRRRRSRRATRSATAAPRVTTPWRSSSSSATARGPHGRVGLALRAAATSARPPVGRAAAGRHRAGRPAPRSPRAADERPAYRARGVDGRARCAVRPPPSRARSGASVSFVEQPGPGEVPQRGGEVGVVLGAEADADGVGERAEEVGAAAGEHVEHALGGARRGVELGVGLGQGQRREVGRVQGHPAVVAGQRRRARTTRPRRPPSARRAAPGV